jgi:hypothetical protein
MELRRRKRPGIPGRNQINDKIKAATLKPRRVPAPPQRRRKRPPEPLARERKWSSPADCARLNPPAPANEASRLRRATADSIVRLERAAVRATRFGSATGCTRSAATRRRADSTPVRFPPPIGARNREVEPEPPAGRAVNYQCALPCNIQSSPTPRPPCHMPSPPRRLSLFRYSHLRASRTRIRANLVRAGLNHLLREQPQTSLSRQPLKRVLHETIFQRVVTEDDPPSS